MNELDKEAQRVFGLEYHKLGARRQKNITRRIEIDKGGILMNGGKRG